MLSSAFSATLNAIPYIIGMSHYNLTGSLWLFLNNTGIITTHGSNLTKASVAA